MIFFFYDKKKWKCKYVYKLFRIYANLVDSMHHLCIIWEIVSIQVNDNPSLLKPSIHRITNQGIKETIIRVHTLLKRNKQCLPWLRMNQEGKVRERFFRRSWNVNAIDRNEKHACIVNRDKRSRAFEERQFVLEFDLFRASRKYEIALLRVINHLFTSSGKKRTIALNCHLYLSRIILGFHLQQCFPILLLRFRFKMFSSRILSFIIISFSWKNFMIRNPLKSCIS